MRVFSSFGRGVLQYAPTIMFAFIIFCSCSAPRSFDDDYKKAEENFVLGNNDVTLTLYQSLVERYPNDKRRPVIMLRIANIYDSIINDEEMAIKAYGRLIREHPFSDASKSARERRAELLEKKGDIDGATEDYSSLIKYFPNVPDNYRYRLMLVGAYFSQRNFSQARIELKPLFDAKNVPADIKEETLFAAAESYFLDGHASEAVPYYQELIKVYPKSKLISEAKLHLATCAEEMGYLGAAKEITKEASEAHYPNQKVIDMRLKSLSERGTKIEKSKEK